MDQNESSIAKMQMPDWATPKMIPDKFLPYLGEFGPQVIDKNAGVAVGYGHAIVGEKLGQDAWLELSAYGKQVYVNPGPQGYWVLVTKVLSKIEAVQTYGPITSVQYGPRGGFKSVTYGKTTFVDKLMKIERV